MDYDDLLKECIKTARLAGDTIMGFYDGEIASEHKGDGSPITQADLAAHNIIVNTLSKLTPEISIISEESEDKKLPDGEFFWLVDPLDGTKEFINKNGEFTVNIALIQNGMPILGVVYAPALDQMYIGNVPSNEAYKDHGDSGKNNIKVSYGSIEGSIVVGSRSHNDEEKMSAFLKGEKIKSFVGCGSSLKFCLIAEGKAQLYPRLGRTMEWDTAAGHAVLLAAGGSVKTLEGAPLVYGKNGLDNPHFIASYV